MPTFLEIEIRAICALLAFAAAWFLSRIDRPASRRPMAIPRKRGRAGR